MSASQTLRAEAAKRILIKDGAVRHRHPGRETVG